MKTGKDFLETAYKLARLPWEITYIIWKLTFPLLYDTFIVIYAKNTAMVNMVY